MLKPLINLTSELATMSQTPEQVLATAKLYSDDQNYIVIRLPTSAVTVAAGVVAEIGEPFCALIVDKDEVSLIIPADARENFEGRFRDHLISDHHFRLITFDVVLDMELTGFMAHVSQALANANVPILPLAAYSRDHILVPEHKFDIAMAVLQQLQSAP